VASTGEATVDITHEATVRTVGLRVFRQKSLFALASPFSECRMNLRHEQRNNSERQEETK
jgi:hypothetical protein